MALTLQNVAQAKIASPPGVYFQIREVIENPDGTFEEISQIISGDPGLAARLLKIVNSPFYGLSTKVETVAHALGIVGSNQLSELALATSMIAKFDGIPEDLLNIQQFWKHSIACGVAARHIATQKGLGHPERYYIMGMLHDLGKLVLVKEIPEEYGKVLTQAREDGEAQLIDLEAKQLRFNHAQVGWILLKEWKLPPTLVAAINYHHDPLKAKEFVKEASVVHVADFLAYEMGMKDGCEAGLPKLFPETLKELSLSIDFIKEAKPIIQSQTDEIMQLFLSKS